MSRTIFTTHRVPRHDEASVNKGGVGKKAFQSSSGYPMADLLVREAIQNSSDAAMNVAHDNLVVDFVHGAFATQRLAECFDGSDPIRDFLLRKYPDDDGRHEFLEIRDKGAEGLTGATNYALEDDNAEPSNYLNLVCEVGEAQSKQGAGGNFGFGKAMYFEAGIGLVFFYSRIKLQNGGYESRLVATYNEDASLYEHATPEKQRRSLLRRYDRRNCGRGWWGVDCVPQSQMPEPVKDEGAIGDFLKVFGLQPFGPEQTGTSIIIPYLQSERLIQGAYPADVDADDDDKAHDAAVAPEQLRNFDSYLRLAIARWYCPRLNNRALDYLRKKGAADVPKRLVARVQDLDSSKPDVVNTTGIFELLQFLYTYALFGICDFDYSALSDSDIKASVRNWHKFVIAPNSGNDKDEEVMKVPLRKLEGKVAGALCVAKVSMDDVSTPGENIYQMLGVAESKQCADSRCPVLAMARELGMIVDFESISSRWLPASSGAQGDEILVAFFVPKNARISDADVCESLSIAMQEKRVDTLLEYLRQCEQSDHFSWRDVNEDIVIVNAIARNVNSRMEKLLNPGRAGVHGETEKVQRQRLAKLFLPNSGVKPSHDRRPARSSSGGGKRLVGAQSFVFEIVGTKLGNEGMAMDFELSAKDAEDQRETTIIIQPEIVREGGKTLVSKWREETGAAAPCHIDSLTLAQKGEIVSVCAGQMRLLPLAGSASIYFDKPGEFDKPDEGDKPDEKVPLIKITLPGGASTSGTISLKARNRNYEIDLCAKDVENEKGQEMNQ